jgi:hypothetical protein
MWTTQLSDRVYLTMTILCGVACPIFAAAPAAELGHWAQASGIAALTAAIAFTTGRRRWRKRQENALGYHKAVDERDAYIALRAWATAGQAATAAALILTVVGTFRGDFGTGFLMFLVCAAAHTASVAWHHKNG